MNSYDRYRIVTMKILFCSWLGTDRDKRGWKKFPIRKGKGEKGGLEMMSYNSKVRVRQWFNSQYQGPSSGLKMRPSFCHLAASPDFEHLE